MERIRSVLGGASVHTGNAAFEAFSAPEQYCFTPLLKVECSVSDRVLKQSESSLNTCEGGILTDLSTLPFWQGLREAPVLEAVSLPPYFMKNLPVFKIINF